MLEGRGHLAFEQRGHKVQTHLSVALKLQNGTTHIDVLEWNWKGGGGGVDYVNCTYQLEACCMNTN